MLMHAATLVLAVVFVAPDVDLVAHRGESADAPENTLAAFRLAWERKVPGIELDVHLTSDNKLIVSHDADTKRTSGVEKVIKQSTLAELRPLDVGRWKDPKWTGETMPTLDEALATIPDQGKCFIEVKVGPEAIPALVESVKKSGKRDDQLVIISFNADTIAEAKRKLPHLRAYYLAGFRKDKETGAWSPSAEELIAKAKEIKADALNLSAQGPIDREFVGKVKSAGLGMFVWTVDKAADAQRFVDAGVDGITSNRPSWLKNQLRNP